MKRWFIFVLVLCVAGLVRAQGTGEGAPGAGRGPQAGGPRSGPPAEITKEQFIAHAQMIAERRGVEFDQAAAEARFDELDKNQDGVLSGDERPKGPDMNRPRGRGAEITKEQFMERQKKVAERMGEEFDPAVAEARFDMLDKNKDGVLSPDERGRKGKKSKPAEESEEETSSDEDNAEE